MTQRYKAVTIEVMDRERFFVAPVELLENNMIVFDRQMSMKVTAQCPDMERAVMIALNKVGGM